MPPQTKKRKRGLTDKQKAAVEEAVKTIPFEELEPMKKKLEELLRDSVEEQSRRRMDQDLNLRTILALLLCCGIATLVSNEIGDIISAHVTTNETLIVVGSMVTTFSLTYGLFILLTTGGIEPILQSVLGRGGGGGGGKKDGDNNNKDDATASTKKRDWHQASSCGSSLISMTYKTTEKES